MPRGYATAHKGGSAVRWFYAPRMGAAFALPNITPRAPRPCSPIFRVCAWSFHLRPNALTACCSPPSATPIRWCSWSQHASTAPRGVASGPDNGVRDRLVGGDDDVVDRSDPLVLVVEDGLAEHLA